MTGRIVYADVPHASAAPEWLWPLYLAGNAAVYAANVGPAVTARVRWSREIEGDGARPIVYITWHRHNYASIPALRALPPSLRPALVMHDGAASRALTHQSSAWIGFDSFVYRRRSEVSPREQMIAYVRREGRHLLVLPDAGGPYGRMKPGVIEIAARTGALLQPLSFRCRPAVSVGRAMRHVLPLPFAAIDVLVGPPLDGAAASMEDCQQALDDLERRRPATGR